MIGTALKMCIELSAKIVPRVSLIQFHPKDSIDPDFGMQIASEMDRVTAEDRYEDMAQRVSTQGMIPATRLIRPVFGLAGCSPYQALSGIASHMHSLLFFSIAS